MDGNGPSEKNDVLDYYAAGIEDQRLQTGIGKIEFERTKDILRRYLPHPPAVIYDIGGGVGVYSFWLAQQGYTVHLFDLSRENVGKACSAHGNPDTPRLASIQVADARCIDHSAETADVVLLMGPLYHLQEHEERVKALVEAKRLLKQKGLLVAAGITRFGNMLDGLATCGQSKWLDEPEFIAMIEREIREGQHICPEKFPEFFTRAYFHLPEGLRSEVLEAGFEWVEVLAVEGPGWLPPQFEEYWSDEERRALILKIVRMVEKEPSILGLSPHFLALAQKPA